MTSAQNTKSKKDTEMTDPKALTAEREAFEAWAGPLEYDLRPMCDMQPDWGDDYISPATVNVWCAWMARATREQTASTGEPVGWFESPHGQFRANPLYRISSPPQTLAWSIPLYAAPVEQAGSPPLVNPAQPSGKEKTHIDHPLRHWDRTCPGCVAEDQSFDEGYEDARSTYAQFLGDLWERFKDGFDPLRKEEREAFRRLDAAIASLKAPADCDPEATSLEPGAPEQDAKKGEQAGSLESSSMDYGGGPFYGVEPASDPIAYIVKADLDAWLKNGGPVRLYAVPQRAGFGELYEQYALRATLVPADYDLEQDAKKGAGSPEATHDE